MSESSANPRVLVVVPARYGSSRFPGKALADLEGAPLIVRVMENAARIEGADRVVAATDDERIRDAVRAAGFEAVMTGEHDTGTARVGEVASADPADVVVNLQGDEPLLAAETVDILLAFLREHPACDVATCGHPFDDPAAWRDPHTVKVLCDKGDRALYFSRAAIPGTFPGRAETGHEVALRHVGIYAFRRAALERFLTLPTGALEACEGLEQLRALEDGMTIGVARVARGAVGVDTPEDLEVVRRLWRRRG